MTYDPRQAGPDLADLWPSLTEDGAPSPLIWAQALAALPRQTEGAGAPSSVRDGQRSARSGPAWRGS